MNDVLFKNVKMYDGSGAAAQMCDVSVSEDKIAAVAPAGSIKEYHASVIDGTGLSLAPGFIDAHSHSDTQVLIDPGRDCKLRQGVTTEIAGQCGASRGPTADPVNPVYLKHVQTTNSSKTVLFRTYDDMMAAIAAVRPANNQMSFVGHNNIRGSVMGMENRPATAKELDAMKDLVDGAMKMGAPGYSTGLVYSPSQYGSTEELIELAKVVAKYNGIYTTHMRGEGAHLYESVKEAVRIAREAGVRTNISHLKVMMQKNRPLLKQSLALIEQANAEGCEIFFDVYPYTASSAGFLSTLPPSYLSHGIDWLVEELSTPEGVKRLEEAIMHPTEAWENILLNNGFDKDLLVTGRNLEDAVGKTYHQYAQERGMSDVAAFADMIVRSHGAGVDVRFLMDEEDIEMLYGHPLCMVGSDGVYAGQGNLTHPRAFATFTRYLGRYIREKKILPFEEGIHRITGMTADRYHIKNKGYIRVGYDADLVLFDDAHIIDHADYTDPFKPNEGIEMVFVGGQAAVANDRLTGVRNGKIVRYAK